MMPKNTNLIKLHIIEYVTCNYLVLTQDIKKEFKLNDDALKEILIECCLSGELEVLPLHLGSTFYIEIFKRGLKHG